MSLVLINRYILIIYLALLSQLVFMIYKSCEKDNNVLTNQRCMTNLFLIAEFIYFFKVLYLDFTISVFKLYFLYLEQMIFVINERLTISVGNIKYTITLLPPRCKKKSMRRIKPYSAIIITSLIVQYVVTRGRLVRSLTPSTRDL